MSPDKPNPFVYNIQFAEETAQKHYAPQAQLLYEMCAYGSNLLIRCFRDPKNQIEDAIIIACLLRQFLTHLDAVSVLVAKGCGDAALIHLRAMLEEEIYLNWLVKEQTAVRAKHLYVWNLRRRRRGNRVVDPATDEAREAKTNVGPDFAGILDALQTTEHQAGTTMENANIDRILTEPEFAKIDRAFEALRKNRPFDVEWYKPCGPASIAAVAKEVNMTAHYRFFYSRWSLFMHSSGFFDHLHVDDLGAAVEQIRDVEEIANAASMASSMAIGVFRTVLRRYRPGELDAFGIKYLTEWRQRARNIPKVSLHRKTADR